jgi:hypothetical protein
LTNVERCHDQYPMPTLEACRPQDSTRDSLLHVGSSAALMHA